MITPVVAETVYSLSEIEAQAKKAVRGAGFFWGHAEEAAQAVRLLAAYQLPGPVLLAAYLTERAGEMTFSAPVVADNVWAAADSGQALCPLLSGAVLCDHAQTMTVASGEVTLTELAYPLLVVPYVAMLSRCLNCALQVSWEGVVLTCHQERLSRIDGDNAALLVTRAGRFSCRVMATTDSGVAAGNVGQVINDKVWRALNDFAQLTYVPATEISRRGAGPAD